MSLFWKLVDRGVIKYIKAKKRSYISTNDLDDKGKLMKNHLEQRKQRRQKENESKIFDGLDVDLWR